MASVFATARQALVLAPNLVGDDSAFGPVLKAQSLVPLVLSGAQLKAYAAKHLALVVKSDATIRYSDSQLNEYKNTLINSLSENDLRWIVTNQAKLVVTPQGDGKFGIVGSESSHLGLTDNRPYIVTQNGVVYGSKDSAATAYFQGVFASAGLPTALELPEPLGVSALDFIPFNSKLAFLGVTVATSNESARWILDGDAVGTHTVAVVRDCFDRQSPRSHLVNVFNFVDTTTAIVSQAIAGKENVNRRLVTEYQLGIDGLYHQTLVDLELTQYLEHLGFKVVVVPTAEAEASPNNGLGFIHTSAGNVLISADQAKLIAWLLTNTHTKLASVQLPTTSSLSSLLVLIRANDVNPTPPKPSATPVDSLYTPWKADRTETPKQTTNTILVVSPVGFISNPQTLLDNHFMKQQDKDASTVEHLAMQEFSLFHRALTDEGVQVFLNCNERFYGAPDALFPNNWFSTHVPGEDSKKRSTLFLYPMKAPARRAERRAHIIKELQSRYDRVVSYTNWEEHGAAGLFLEGTGSLLIDRVNRVAYCLISQRADATVFKHWCSELGYTPVAFRAVDGQGRTIYHTNVMMAIGTSVAVLCADSIKDPAERAHVIEALSKHHQIVTISFEQMDQFCGNVLEVRGSANRKLLAMSSRAYNGFTQEQRDMLLNHVDKLVHVPVPTIEDIGGGGVRCMMGELF